MKHELLAVEYLKGRLEPLGLRDLDPGAGRFYRPGAFTSAPAITYQGDTPAFYAQDTIEFVPNWKLTLGARHDSLDAEYSSLNSRNSTSARPACAPACPGTRTHTPTTTSATATPSVRPPTSTSSPAAATPPSAARVTELGAKDADEGDSPRALRCTAPTRMGSATPTSSPPPQS